MDGLEVMTKQPLIFIVEDDQMIAELLAYNLKEAGYTIRIFNEGNELFQTLEQQPALLPDLFILDLMLPGMDGFAICKTLKQANRFDLIPVLMLTARSSEADKVRGLESGADDYLTKPFGMRELQARVQALLRRYYKTLEVMKQAAPAEPSVFTPVGQVSVSAEPGQPVDNATSHVLPGSTGASAEDQSGLHRCRDLLLDDIRHRVYKTGREIDMTHREYELLKFLMINRGIAFSRDDLLDQVWGFAYGGETRTVDVHIRQLRRKLEDDPGEPVLIETVRGHGYRFTDKA